MGGMRIVARPMLRSYWEANPDSEESLRAWHSVVKRADWSTPQELKAQIRNASILKKGRVVFNIKGNTYRLVTSINYDYRMVYVRFIGTHKEYDQIDAEEV
jgi:mRNA interferase HigB